MRAYLALIVGAAMLSPALAGAGTELAPPSGWVEINGTLYRAEKAEVEGVETVRYYAGEQVLTPDELRAFVASQPPVKLTPAARAAFRSAAPDAPLALVIMLRGQPAGPLSRALRAQAEPQLELLAEQVRAVTRTTLLRPSMPPELERDWTPPALHAADLAARQTVAEIRDELERDLRVRIGQAIDEAVAPEQAAVATLVERLGGEVVAYINPLSMLGVILPADRVALLAADPRVARIDLNHPGCPELDNHRHSLGLETGFWPAGITGGVHDVGVLDTGVQQNHPALRTHRFLSNMGVNDTGTHGTGMAGILCSTDTLYRGMAYGLDTIVVALAGDINTSMPGMHYIANTGEPENCNYSFGNGTANDGDYMPTDQFFDGVIDTFGYMVSKSTGNNGWSTGTTITHPAPAFNLMASANMEDYNTIPRADDRITSSSSVGPTLGGRKKPDITAPGTNSMSCTPSGGFANIGGTSSASPHTGGGIVLLWDMGVTSVMAGKAVLLNTTDAITDNGTSSIGDDQYVQGSLWNRRYGWGYLNLGAAYQHGLDVFIDSVPDRPENADFRLYVGQMFNYERATLVWQRHVAYNGATFPTQIEGLSDLDLTAWREPTGALLASSESRIDNVEQFHVTSDGLVVLKVEAFGQFDPNVPTEPFAIATQENFVRANGPAFATTFTRPRCAELGAQFNITVDVYNTGDVAAHEVLVQLDGVTVIGGQNPAMLGTIPAAGSAAASWTVQAANTAGTYPLTATIGSNSYGEMFTGTGASTYRAGNCDRGDLNCDGQVNFDDINPFVLALTDPAGYAIAYPSCNILNGDCNGDGVVNFDDINPFVALLSGQ